MSGNRRGGREPAPRMEAYAGPVRQDHPRSLDRRSVRGRCGRPRPAADAGDGTPHRVRLMSRDVDSARKLESLRTHPRGLPRVPRGPKALVPLPRNSRCTRRHADTRRAATPDRRPSGGRSLVAGRHSDGPRFDVPEVPRPLAQDHHAFRHAHRPHRACEAQRLMRLVSYLDCPSRSGCGASHAAHGAVLHVPRPDSLGEGSWHVRRVPSQVIQLETGVPQDKDLGDPSRQGRSCSGAAVRDVPRERVLPRLSRPGDAPSGRMGGG